MLTPDDQRADGSRAKYLQRVSQYRRFDPELFDRLAMGVGSGVRGIDFVEGSGLLPRALFHSELIPDDGAGRAAYFDAAFSNLSEAEVVFFDPDNGFEIDSCRPGQKGSNRYLCWDEARSFFDRGQSVIVYQHFARENRELHIRRLVKQMWERFSTTAVFAFRTPYVVFLLAAQKQHRAWFEARCEELRRKWDEDQIASSLCEPEGSGTANEGAIDWRSPARGSFDDVASATGMYRSADWSGALRRQLSHRVREWAERSSIPYYLSLGQTPTVLFYASADGRAHGNFHPDVWTAIRSKPAWLDRLEKRHPKPQALPAERAANVRELDSSNSSDALLMNCLFKNISISTASLVREMRLRDTS